MTDDDDLEASVRNLVLTAFLDDQAAGVVRTLGEYQAMHPGHEACIADELGSLLAAPTPRLVEHIGRYEIRRELGRGGQATVYLAHDPRLQRDVALKVLPRGLATPTEELRLQREATSVARIDDSGVCPVYEVGRDGEHLFLAMKYVAGETLAAQLTRERAHGAPPRPIGSTLAFFAALAGSLHRAHETGVVHRDLKPANVMVDERGQPVLLDFGLAGTKDGTGTGLTRTGDVFGTPHYLPPERLRGEVQGDVQGDVWAIGVALFETLTGRRPFDAPTLELLYRQILADEPPSLRSLRPDASRDLAAVVGTCLCKDLRRRYRTALDLAQDLRALQRGEPVRARVPSVAQRLWQWHRRHAVGATAGWLLLAGLVSTISVQQRALAEVRAAQAETDGLNEFLVRKMLLAVTPEEARGRKVTAEEVFDRAMQNVREAFAEPSRTAGTLQHVLGLANEALGRRRVARECMEQALVIRTAVLGPEARETLQSQAKLAAIEIQDDPIEAGRQRLAATLALQRAVLGPHDADTLGTINDEILLAITVGKYEEAVRLGRAAVDQARAAFGPRSKHTLTAMGLLARALGQIGRRTEAEPLLREVLAARIEERGADAPAVAKAYNEVAVLLHDLALRDGIEAKWAEAEPLYELLLERTRVLHGGKSFDHAVALNNFASFLQDRAAQERKPELLQRAIALLRESLAVREALDGPTSTRVATAACNLGTALCGAGTPADALPFLERGFRIRDITFGRLHPETVKALFNLTLVTRYAHGPATVPELAADLETRLAECTDIDARTRLAYGDGLLSMHFRGGEFQRIVQQGPALYAQCLEQWPGDGGPTGRNVAKVIADAAAKVGDVATEAQWRARTQPRR
ncbi:MAG: serine/threonine protein kinase [Planctomycetes bacterium]|nr:serine/threonine protein kinase [Planctomycetota bacterium]